MAAEAFSNALILPPLSCSCDSWLWETHSPIAKLSPIWLARVIDPRIGGETRRPDREALCLGGVQQVLPVCTPGVSWLRREPTGTLSAGS